MSEEKNSQTHMKIPYIQAGGDCLGTGWGCDKCYNADGSCACAEGTQPWGCGAGQKPVWSLSLFGLCIKNDEYGSKVSSRL